MAERTRHPVPALGNARTVQRRVRGGGVTVEAIALPTQQAGAGSSMARNGYTCPAVHALLVLRSLPPRKGGDG